MISEKIKKIQFLKQALDELADDEFLERVEVQNSWFIKEFTQTAIRNICDEYLDQSKMGQWLSQYPIDRAKGSVGIILAGNIPLVGFHDILCSYFTADKVAIKLSSKDSYLTKWVLDKWKEIDEEWAQRLTIVERIEHCDAIIATGSNNTYNYFQSYFKKYKHILRKNRTSIAIIHKDISDEELNSLMDDIFLYFGLGCRNVSKLWIEKGFSLDKIFEASERYDYFFNQQKYMNNYDYQRTLLLLNKIPHLSNNFLMLKEDQTVFSPISVLHYEMWENKDEYLNDISINDGNIQCVIGKDFIPFGVAQKPSLSDYADGIDTMHFLIS